MNIFTYICSCRCMRVIAVPSSLSLLDEVGRLPEENCQRGSEGPMAERKKEREKTTVFSLLVSVDHSTSASIVFRASRRVNNPLNLVRKTPA